MLNYVPQTSLTPVFSPTESIPPDFTFKIDNKNYYCHRVAVFSLSPILRAKANEIKANGGIYSEFADSNNIKDPKHYFKLICDYFHGKIIEISQENAPFLHKIANIFGLSQLISLTEQHLIPLTNENAIEQMKLYSESGVEYYECADLIASNWNIYQNDPNVFNFPVFAFEQIFDSENLEIDSESTLILYIKRLISVHGNEYSILFRSVKTEEISQNEVDEILTYSELDTIDPDIIDSLKERLLLDIIVPDDEEEQSNRENNQNPAFFAN